jgi:hypothetical protein
MPHWIALLAIVVVAWMILAIVGGWLIGRGLGAIERRSDGKAADAEPERGVNDDLPHAA